MTTHTITIANQKGGCGKTTTAVQLAAGLALMGYKTCLVDTDGQCNASMALGVDPEEMRREKAPSVLDIYLKKRPATSIVREVRPEFFGSNLFLVPGHLALDAVHTSLEAELKRDTLTEDLTPEDEDERRGDHRDRFRRSLETLHGDFDFIVIDTPPSLGFTLSTALRAAEWFIIPVFPSAFELKGLQRLVASADKVRRVSNPSLRLLRVLVAHYDASTTLDAEIYEQLNAAFGDYLSPTKISRSVRQREVYAMKEGGTIYEHPLGRALAEQYRQLVDEVVSAIGAMTDEAEQAHGTLVPQEAVEPAASVGEGRAPALEQRGGSVMEGVVNG